jgi:hypothetical protein
MNRLIATRRISSNAAILIVLAAALQLAGCASTVEKDANKNLFQQALVMQKVQSHGAPDGTSGKTRINKKVVMADQDKIEWIFSAQQMQPDATQKHELFMWFSQLKNYNDNPILLQLGPDWISSYKRGNVLRNMIPRGILIEQQYDDRLPEHQIIFSLKNNNAQLVNAKGVL